MGLFAKLATLTALMVSTTALADELRVAAPMPSDHPAVRSLEVMNIHLQEKTGGRHSLATLTTEIRESSSYVIAQIRNGTLDLALVNIGALSSSLRGGIIPALPFLFESREQMKEVLGGHAGQLLLASFEHSGVIGLALYEGGIRSIYSLKPIRTPEQFRSLNVRVEAGDQTAADVVKNLGARPINVPLARIADSLRVGSLDAVAGDVGLYVSMGHHHVAKYFNKTEHSQPPLVLIFSPTKWRQLSESDRAAIREAAARSTEENSVLLPAYEAAAIRRAEAEGSEFIEVDRLAFQRALLQSVPAQTRP